MAGATIRYTTNGSNPTAFSPIYTAPLTVSTTQTLKAIAFHPDYTASPDHDRRIHHDGGGARLLAGRRHVSLAVRGSVSTGRKLS
jgi:hypothetical protein